ncbi:MAG: MBL fold metallo-hydrolase [Candidatus Binataceae bacterium]|nr:MBL fold metallo-hydrolase [Candidatus Binataceae bacterium]
MITNRESGTNVNEIAAGIYRISTPVSEQMIPGGFTFNQYLVADDEPLLFHCGLRRMFPLMREAVASILPVETLRYLALSHVEADECGALNDWLAAAPGAVPLCGRVAAMTSIEDIGDRPPRAMSDGEALALGKHSVKWFDAPHLPHGWECGLMLETSTRTFLCGDLFTQPGGNPPALTEDDILGPSEAMRARLDYFSHAPNSRALLERFAAERPATLACMHGSAWRGDGAALLRALADIISQ